MQTLWICTNSVCENSECTIRIPGVHIQYQFNITQSADITSVVSTDTADLFVLECDYPEYKDLMCIRSLRCDYSHVPMLVITKRRDTGFIVWLLQQRVWNVLHKPLRQTDIANSISEVKISLERTKRCDFSAALNCGQFFLDQHMNDYTKQVRRTQKALLFVFSRFGQKITLTELARLCNMSKWEFCRIFSKEHGITFKRYLTQYRVERAKEMLANTKLSLTDIALQVGFGSLAHFTREFRKLSLLSPTQFRKNSDDVKNQAKIISALQQP